MKAPYQPIDCAYYDRLEAWATLRETCAIVWLDRDGVRHELRSKIVDLVLKEGVEYLIAENDLQIRLDLLVSVNGIPLTGGSCHF
jgi:Rho-binding antiterminator